MKMEENEKKSLEFAMKLIGLRRRSVFEIEHRLKEKNFSEEIIEKTLKTLKEYKYIDDQEFAESYVRDRIRFNPRGRNLIGMELRRKGIKEKTIEEALQKNFTKEQELEIAEKILKKKFKETDPEQIKKVYAKAAGHLNSKGFSIDIIQEALQNFINNKK